MEEKIAYPPNIEDIRKMFPLHKGIVFTYGDVLYNPDNCFIDNYLQYHELTHAFQQKNKVARWWKLYLEDKAFRFTQELEAYQNQYNLFCQQHKDRNKQNYYLNKLSADLSSEMYGSICSRSEAMRAIKNNLKFK